MLRPPYPELGVFLPLRAFTAFCEHCEALPLQKTTSALLSIMASRIMLLLALPGASPASHSP